MEGCSPLSVLWELWSVGLWHVCIGNNHTFACKQEVIRNLFMIPVSTRTKYLWTFKQYMFTLNTLIYISLNGTCLYEKRRQLVINTIKIRPIGYSSENKTNLLLRTLFRYPRPNSVFDLRLLWGEMKRTKNPIRFTLKGLHNLEFRMLAALNQRSFRVVCLLKYELVTYEVWAATELWSIFPFLV